MKRIEGFTLLEMVIVVLIVGILSTIAFTAYSSNVIKSYRSEAKATLMQAASALERYYAQNYTYVGANVDATAESELEPTVFGVSSTLTSGTSDVDVRYLIQIDGTTVSATSYELKAVAQNTQTKDDDACHELTLDNTGAKGPAECW